MRWKLFLFLFVVLVLGVSSVFALEFDNVKSYDEGKREITITNAFGFGDTIAKVTLLSELDVKVFDRGEGIMQKVAEFEIDNAEKYNNALKKMEFFDVRKNMKPEQRGFEYRYRVLKETREIPIHQKDYCHGEKDCVAPIIDYRTHNTYNWITLEKVKKDDLPEGKIVIGIFLDVKPSEVGEWIPTMFGERIPEFSQWTEGLNTNLVHYYTFNETSGTNALDIGGIGKTQVNITLVPQAAGTAEFIPSGLFGNSVFVDTTGGGGSYAKTNANIGMSGTDTFFVSLWVNRTDPDVSPAFLFGDSNTWPTYFSIQGTGNPSAVRIYWAGADTGIISACFNSNGSAFNHVIWGQSAGNQLFYCDGTLLWNSTYASKTINEFRIGNQQYEDAESEINFDEMAVFNKSLTPSQISDLYNNGLGITYTTDFSDPPAIDLIAPLSQNFTTHKTIEFSANASDVSQVNNITLILNGTLNSTQSGSSATLTFNKTLSLGDGTWTYYFNATDDNNEVASSITQTITIDSVVPTVDIIAPIYQTEFVKLGDTLNLNYVYVEANPNSCYYVYGGINTTITCGVNATLNIDTTNRSVEVWISDTLGNRANDTQPFVFSLLEVNGTIFTDNVLEGSTNQFRANISYLSSNFSNIQGILHYNNTVNTGTQTGTGDSVEFSTSVAAALVTAKTNVSFYWEIKLTNSSGTYPFNLTNSNQTVNNINIDTCTSFNILFINYSLVDEGTQIPLNASLYNTSIEYALQLYPLGSNNAVVNISGNFSKNNNGQICLEQDFGTASYILDLITSYGGDSYSEEHYYIQNATLTNASLPQNIGLYDLRDIDSTDFLINFKDASYLLVEGALVNINRKYLSEGVFKTVEIQKTDENGNAVGHFDTNGVLYTIIVTKFGEILGTFNNVAVICQDALIGDCDLNLKATASITPLESLKDLGNLSYSMVFDADARTITTTFITTDGTSKLVSINATNFDRFGNNTICSTQLQSPSGTIICSIPTSYGNATIISALYENGNQVIQKVYTIQPDVYAQFGDDMGALVIILVMTIPMMAITSTIGFIISIVIGLIMVSMLMLFSTSTIIGVGSSVVWLIIAAGILVYKIARRGTL